MVSFAKDFVCFGFESDFQGFREKIYTKWNAMMERKSKGKEAKNAR